MITIDETMIIHIINMLILIVVMNAVLYKPVRTILEERHKKINEMEKDIENFNRNAKLRLEEFDRKLNDARRQAKDELDKVRHEAAGVANETLNSTRQEVDGIKGERISQIHTDLDVARRELKGQIESFATDMVGKILGRAI